MADSIFISYRRSESAKDARALYERLSHDFGRSNVFIDLEGIAPGEDFATTIEGQLDGCSVLLALIGKDWLHGLNEAGQRRLDDEGDFVHIEISRAIVRGVRVIPVLVDGAAPPKAAELPLALRALARRQAVVLDFHRFDADLVRLSAAIRKALAASQEAAPQASASMPVAFKVGVIGVCVVLLMWLVASLFRAQDARSKPIPKAATAAPPARPAAKPFRDCEDAACPWLVAVEKGRFLMGSPAGERGRVEGEALQHEMNMATALAVMQAEVTRGQFSTFVEAAKQPVDPGCNVRVANKMQWDTLRDWRNPGFEQTDAHPVVCVSWNDAAAYARWLSDKTGKAYRLLTEAEWEYAARAGTSTRYSFGDRQDDLCGHANVADRRLKEQFGDRAIADCADGHATTAPVRSFKANTWGLHDMHGNAREWVQDCWLMKGDEKAPVKAAGAEPENCAHRAARGGAWSSEPDYARSASRVGNPAGYRASNLGFRLVRVMP